MSVDETRSDTPQAPQWWKARAPQLGITFGVGLLLAISGAFETGQTPLVFRLAYWLPIMAVGSLIGWVVADNILKVERWTGSAWLAWLAVTIVVGVIMGALVYCLGLMIGWAPWGLSPFLGHLVPSFAISGLMSGVGIFLNQVPQTTRANVAETSGQSGPANAALGPKLLDRLPPRLYGATLLAVEAQDHYLKVYSSRGNDMILMRLSDAITELHGIEGARVHRSWWVARAGIEKALKYNGKAILTLEGGLQVPVSRSYVRALREAGWI